MADVVKIISTALVDHFKQIDSLKSRLEDCRSKSDVSRLFIDDDDAYQEQLELQWEVSDLRSELLELERSTARIAEALNVDITE